MTEVDAMDVSIIDTEEAIQRLKKIKSPDEAVALFTKFVEHRCKGLSRDQGPIGAESNQDREAAMSERIAIVGCRTMIAQAKRGDPEATRALLLWQVGSKEQGSGFLQRYMELLPKDARTGASLQRVEDTATKIREMLDRADQHMFSTRLDSLPPAYSRVVHGELERARTAMIGDDGETARHKFGRARRMIQKFEKMAEHKKRVWAVFR